MLLVGSNPSGQGEVFLNVNNPFAADTQKSIKSNNDNFEQILVGTQAAMNKIQSDLESYV